MVEQNAEANAVEVAVQDRFEQVWTGVERALFVVMAAIVLAGLTGLLGDGWLSSQSRTLPGAKVSYDRFLRDRGQAHLTVELTGPMSAPVAHVAFDHDFLDRNHISASIPRPSATVATASGAEYDFQLGPERRGRIVFVLEPQGIGPWKGRLGVDAASFEAGGFIYP